MTSTASYRIRETLSPFELRTTCGVCRRVPVLGLFDPGTEL